MGTKKTLVRGELVLPVIVVMNSFGVVLMLYSGTGISAISSMTYALSEVLPVFSLGTWTYIFQSMLVLSLMILRKRFVPQPIIPTDFFPKELSDITGTAFSRIKVSFDLICVAITAVLTFVCLGGISGLGIGTLLSALTMGKVVGRLDGWMDRHVEFVTYQRNGSYRRRKLRLA